MREWAEANKYNPFNSYKGLMWEDSHYKPIRAWFKGEGELPPPIEISFDTCHNCNFSCPHCNSQRHINKGKGVLSKQKMLDLIHLFSEWGAKAVCFGGGGEPLLNKNLGYGIERVKRSGMECGVATNGSSIMLPLMGCKWVAISVDAATKKTFKKVHGCDSFKTVKNNISFLVRHKKHTVSNVYISYRFLITPGNWREISKACQVAKRLGVDSFHARPADLGRPDVPMEVNYDTEQANQLLEECHKYETKDFKVVTARHKFSKNFEIIHPFKNCVSSPLVLQACADGNAYVCPDHKLEERFKLCKTTAIRRYWGSDKHRELLQSIDVDKECSRCTWGEYQRQIEELSDDKMHRNFP